MTANEYPAPSERAAVLLALQRAKMARSAHAYVRGSTTKFYEWLGSSTTRSLPEGPAIWICGDCHLGNLGPVADLHGATTIRIRDLDQTVVGNPAHDLIRLGLSLASAARGSDLPGIITARMIEHLVDGYVVGLGTTDDQQLEIPNVLRPVVKQALKRRWRDLAKERLEDPSPVIPLGKRFWPLSPEEKECVISLAADDNVKRMVTSLRGRDSDDPVEILDAAFWVKGCSSLGLLRCAVLIGVGSGRDRRFALVDIKEAIAPAAPRASDARMPRDNGWRITEGARRLSPPLGRRIAAGRVCSRAVFVRELLPQDLKLELASLTEADAVVIARFLAAVLGQSHGRQLDGQTVRRWQAELQRNRSKSLDAPSWLWISIVELLTIHEGAYLDHCRRYANAEA